MIHCEVAQIRESGTTGQLDPYNKITQIAIFRSREAHARYKYFQVFARETKNWELREKEIVTLCSC